MIPTLPANSRRPGVAGCPTQAAFAWVGICLEDSSATSAEGGDVSCLLNSSTVQRTGLPLSSRRKTKEDTTYFVRRNPVATPKAKRSRRAFFVFARLFNFT